MVFHNQLLHPFYTTEFQFMGSIRRACSFFCCDE
jgi:hypothetical protein